MRNKKLLTLIGSVCLVLVLAALPFMAACPAPEEEEEPPPEVQTLNIGCTIPYNSPMGIDTKRLDEIIIDDLNKAGGLVVKGIRYRVNMIMYDDAYSADKGRAAIERLIYQDKVRHIVGTLSSPVAAAGIAVTEANDVLFLAACQSEKVIGPGTRYSCRLSIARSYTVACVDYLLSACPEAKSLVIIEPDNETGHASAPMWMPLLEAYGIDVETLYYPYGEADFSPLAVKIMALNPDIVAADATEGGTDLGLLLKALHAAGYQGSLYSTIFDMGKVSEVASDEAMEGLIIGVNSWDNPNAPGYIKEMKQEFEERYGYWSSMDPTFCNPWYAFFAAVKKADSLEPGDIAAAMEGLEFDSLMGEGCLMIKGAEVDRYADCVSPLNYGRIHNGSIVWEKLMSAAEIVKACEEFYGEEWR